MNSKSSPIYHPGELHWQDQTGRREKLEKTSRVLMRDHLIDQHQDFFNHLSYVFLGTLDESGHPMATILTGPEGFISSPDTKILRISTTLEQLSPMGAGIAPESHIAVLGIDLSNRRRNRMHGRVAQADKGVLDIIVIQSYGNCPKYINTRVIDTQSPRASKLPSVLPERTSLSTRDQSLIENSGSFFIASAHSDGSGADYEGADISHRGGRPGFVQVENENTLVVPDYQGNFMFNTLGNLFLNPNTGLLFIDFEKGDLLQLNGTAEVITGPVDTERFPGAERLLRLVINRAVRTTNATGMRWQFVEQSPFNPELHNARH